jgi:hypothetical protein
VVNDVPWRSLPTLLWLAALGVALGTLFALR